MARRKSQIKKIITQNIDNLHQSSGIPENKIIELHGNSSYAKCLECKSKYELQTVKEEFQSQPVESRKSPCCKKCGGIIKTATISFGQPMPAKEMKTAESATLASDLFIAIGSSLQVYPAASFPILASNNGAKLVIINRETTDLDKIANLVINEDEPSSSIKPVYSIVDLLVIFSMFCYCTFLYPH